MMKTVSIYLLLLGLVSHVFSQKELPPIPVTINVHESMTRKSIPRTVCIVYEQDSVVGQYISDSLGNLRLNIRPYKLWRLELVADGFYPVTAEMDTRKLSQIKLVTQVSMTPKGWYRFKGVLLDEAFEYFLKDVHVKLYDQDDRRSFYSSSDANGVYFFNLIPGHNYQVWIDDDRYFRSHSAVFDCRGEYEIGKGVSTFCTTGFTLQDIKTDHESGLKTIVGTNRISEIKVGEKFQLNNIYYDSGSAQIRVSSAKALDGLVKLLKENPNIQIEVSAHTDSKGQADFNLKLSQKRAEAVKTYLVKASIESKRVVPKGYGETKLLNKCKDGVDCSDKEHAENRRTAFLILAK